MCDSATPKSERGLVDSVPRRGNRSGGLEALDLPISIGEPLQKTPF